MKTHKSRGKKSGRSRVVWRLLSLLLAASMLVPYGATASEPLPPKATEAIAEMERGVESHEGPEVAQVERWSLQSYTQTQLTDYDAMFRVKPKSASNNGGQYGSSSLDRAWDENRNSHWETGRSNSGDFKNHIEFVFEKPEEIGRIIYGARSDIGPKGFATRFEVWGAEESGKPLSLVATGSQAATGDLVEISFRPRKFQVLRFVWVEANQGWASARCMFFYKEDTLPDQIMGLFTDSATTALAAGTDKALVDRLREQLKSYPLPGQMSPYLDMAEKLLSSSGSSITQAPMTLSQRGNRGSEAGRTATSMTLGTFDLSGYYARPGEKLGVYVSADPKGPMPSIVLATVAQNPWDWAYGGDGLVLSNGYNLIEVPKDMKSCQAIYFCNPALPDQQAFAPTVRLVGGTKYPVYRYDPADMPEVTRAKEAAFLKELEEYVKGVTDVPTAQAGKGNYNMCEFVSDKYLSSTSARGALVGVKTKALWNKGEWRDAIKTTKYGVVEKDADGNPTGISYTGPAATMECFEMFYDALSLYSGFNMDDPTSEDYRNRNQFIFRAYTNGAGAGWGQSIFAGLNTGDQPDGNKWDGGDYAGLASGASVLNAGWLLYHEIGHVFDNGIIGTSESTNNLFALMGQDKFLDTNRLVTDDRWYEHFTNYINTGLLPQNDLLFYPGAVVYQLNAVDFSKTKLYKDEGISNYGLACRYARLHRDEMNGLSKNNKLVLSLSMGCGVDLSPHFEFYGRTVSNEVKQLLAGLPKESRPTWLVNDRTFAGGAFSAEDKSKSPAISSGKVNETNAEVTLVMDSTVFDEKNLQCFAIYRQELRGGTMPVGEPEFIGVTGDKRKTTTNELYQFIDRNALPGKGYRYTVSAYDCTLLENKNKATWDIAKIPDEATIPVTKLLVNSGDEGYTFSVGGTLPLKVGYYPENATVDLNAIQWSVEGWGRDSAHTGSGPDIITLTEDPAFPGDPTRRLITGIAGGQTSVKVSLNGVTLGSRVVINGNIDLNKEKYQLSFPGQTLALEQGTTHDLSLRRTTVENGQTVNVVRFPGGSTWISSNTGVASVKVVNNVTTLAAHKAGKTTLTYSYNGVERAKCEVTVTAQPVPLNSLKITGAAEVTVGRSEQLAYDLLPANTTVTQTPKWSSNAPGVARVDAKGVVTGISGGTATITAAIGDVSAAKEIRVPAYTALKGITVAPKTVTLSENRKTEQLTIEKNPVGATAGTVTWKSSDLDIATVNERGLVTGIAAGNAVITAHLDGKVASCNVTVALVTALDGLHFKGKEVDADITATLTVAGSQQLMVYPKPLLAGGLSAFNWTTSNPAVATVKEGFIVGTGAGEATITATVTQTVGVATKSYSVSCVVTVKENIRPLTGISISRVAQGLVKGESFTLSLGNRPANANQTAEGGPIGGDSWVSDNPAVATVDNNGVVTAVAEGEAVITGKRGGVEATCRVSVRSEVTPATKVTLDRSKVTLSGLQATAQLKATIEPQTATVSVYWVSDNVNIVQVDQAGNLTPVDEGTAIITATASSQRAQCEVTVTVKKVPPVITEQPKSYLNQSPGGTVTFRVEAKKGSGMELPGALTYAWYRAKNTTEAGELLVEGPSDVYSISSLTADDAGYYYCVVSDHGISTTSARARLTISSGSSGSSGGNSKPPATTPDVPPVKPQQPFIDVQEGMWYSSAVAFVYQRGLFNGVGEGCFEPAGTASRATLVAVLSRLASAKERDTAPPVTFLDVPQDAWYAQALAWAIRAGVVQGVGDGCFAPDAPITREQFVTFLWRYVGSPKTAGSLEKYLDADKVGDYAQEAMRWATENNIIFGNELGNLSPEGQATRAEVAVVLTRFLGGKV